MIDRIKYAFLLVSLFIFFSTDLFSQDSIVDPHYFFGKNCHDSLLKNQPDSVENYVVFSIIGADDSRKTAWIKKTEISYLLKGRDFKVFESYGRIYYTIDYTSRELDYEKLNDDSVASSGNESRDSLINSAINSDTTSYFIVVGSEMKSVPAADLFKYLQYKDFRMVSVKKAVFYILADPSNQRNDYPGCHPRHD